MPHYVKLVNGQLVISDSDIISQGIFCPSLGAELRPHSQLKIANLDSDTISVNLIGILL